MLAKRAKTHSWSSSRTSGHGESLVPAALRLGEGARAERVDQSCQVVCPEETETRQ